MTTTERPTKPATEPKGAVLRRQRLLNRVAEDLSIVERDPRCRKPAFCLAFFELCDGKILTAPEEGLEYALAATRLAAAIGDKHLINLSQGVHAHGLIACQRQLEAMELLVACSETAAGCCMDCWTDLARRLADLMIESHAPEPAILLLDDALAMATKMDADSRCRFLFLRGIAYHLLGDVDRALADADVVLQALSLSSARGFFHDTLAFIACSLKTRERRHYEVALTHLRRFRERIKGLDNGWAEARRTLRWVEGLVLARLGEQKGSVQRLERVWEALVETGPARYAVAITADLAQAHMRTARSVSLRVIQRVVARCLQRSDLDLDHRRQLDEVCAIVRRRPEQAARAIARLRTSFIVPVPGLLSNVEMAEPPEISPPD